MTSKKKPVSRKRRNTTTSKPSKVSAGRLARFLKALSASTITAFSVASCALNPQLVEQLPIEPILRQLGLPGHEQDQVATQEVPAGLLVQTHFVQCPQFFPEGRLPAVPGGKGLRELCFSSFAILHSGQTRTPVFVAQRINRGMLLRASSIERIDQFYADARLPKTERAELDDYRNSGYSRGHMAPAADMHSLQAMTQSFSLANMVPQNQTHNAGAWSQIEQDTRKYVMRAAGDVHIFTGPVYDDRLLSARAGRVAVPTHLYKVVRDATTGRTWVHWQMNKASAKAGPPITYEEFVRRTGLRLLP